MINVFYAQLVYLFIMMKLIKITKVEYIKKLLKCCERLNIDNISFPPTIKDIEQFGKHNPDISITNFDYGCFHKIPEDENNDENTKEGIVIKDVRVSPYTLKKNIQLSY